MSVVEKHLWRIERKSLTLITVNEHFENVKVSSTIFFFSNKNMTNDKKKQFKAQRKPPHQMASRPPYTTDHTATFLQALSSVWLIIPNRLTQRNTFLWSLWLTLLSVPVICWQTRMWADEGKWRGSRGSRVLPLSAKEGSAAATTAAHKQWRDDRAPVCVTVSPV